MKNSVAILAVVGLAASVSAQSTPVLTAKGIKVDNIDRGSSDAVIYEQPTDNSNGLVAQDFSDFPSFSTTEWDEFVLGANANLGKGTAFGIEQGNAGATTDIIAQVWTDIPDRGGVMVAGSSGGSFSGADAVNNFAAEALTGGTTYYYSHWVVRGFGAGGQWFWAATQTITGNQCQFWNPGGGFGFGTQSQDGSNVFGIAYDEGFRLEDDAPPPPPPCYADCDGNGRLDIRDFFCFQAEYAAGCP